MLLARDNPFAVHRVLRERYRLDDAGWSALLARFDSLGRRAALVGPHGAGKTTLLEDLGQRLSARGLHIAFIRLSTDHPRLPATCDAPFFAALGPDDVLLLDGAEQLGPLAWQRFRFHARRAGGLVITTHRAGRLPLLHRCETSPALLQAITASLGQPLDSTRAAALHSRHRGNLREALRELYDQHAARTAPVNA